MIHKCRILWVGKESTPDDDQLKNTPWHYECHAALLNFTTQLNRLRIAKTAGRFKLFCEFQPEEPDTDFTPEPDEIPPPIVVAQQKAVDLENALRSAHFAAKPGRHVETVLANLVGHAADITTRLEHLRHWKESPDGK